MIWMWCFDGKLEMGQGRFDLVGERGFELPTSVSRTRRANQAALLPEILFNF